MPENCSISIESHCIMGYPQFIRYCIWLFSVIIHCIYILLYTHDYISIYVNVRESNNHTMCFLANFMKSHFNYCFFFTQKNTWSCERKDIFNRREMPSQKNTFRPEHLQQSILFSQVKKRVVILFAFSCLLENKKKTKSGAMENGCWQKSADHVFQALDLVDAGCGFPKINICDMNCSW